nr:hypothetical protein [Tanacetum cinerariifolium]
MQFNQWRSKNFKGMHTTLIATKEKEMMNNEGEVTVIVPVSNLIEALAVVKNGFPKMKGLFLFSLMSKITKSTGLFVDESHVGGVGHDVNVGSLIDEGAHALEVSYATRYFEIPSDVLLLCYHFLENFIISGPP